MIRNEEKTLSSDERNQQEKETWISLAEAERRIGVKRQVISKRVKSGKLRHKKSEADERLVLVELNEVREFFSK